MQLEKSKTETTIVIKVYKDGKLIEEKRFKGNSILTCGANTLWNIIAGNITSWQLGICVGNGSTPFSANQTCCQGSLQACVNATNVSVSSNSITVTAVFDADSANFQWNEACIAFTNLTCSNCTYAPLDRVVSALGVKQPGTTWEISITLSLS